MSKDPIIIKTASEIELMRQAGKITAGARSVARAAIADGLTTKQVDKAVNDFIIKSHAIPTFKGYGGFPGSACVSVNEEIIHGIPGKRVIHNGDIVSVDVGATFKGFVGDCAGTYPCGEISEEAKKLIAATKQSFFEGIKMAKAGNHLHDISNAIDEYISQFGYGIVRDLVGHGIGTKLHEDPQIPNFAQKRRGIRLEPGMTLAIEPMINMGRADVEWLDDDWTVVTEDGSLSAHYENTILITEGEPEILTLY